jgi:hypothetical protein
MKMDQLRRGFPADAPTPTPLTKSTIFSSVLNWPLAIEIARSILTRLDRTIGRCG